MDVALFEALPAAEPVLERLMQLYAYDSASSWAGTSARTGASRRNAAVPARAPPYYRSRVLRRRPADQGELFDA